MCSITVVHVLAIVFKICCIPIYVLHAQIPNAIRYHIIYKKIKYRKTLSSYFNIKKQKENQARVKYNKKEQNE